MAFGIFEIIIIVIVIFIWVNVVNKKDVKNIIPKDKWDKTKKAIKSAIYDVKEIEFEVKDTVKEVEEDIKRKHRKDDKKTPETDMEV